MTRPSRKAHEPASSADGATRPAFIDATRRGLLQGAAVAAGATLGAGVAIAADSAQAEPATSPPESRGYRLTDHVREYYAKARF